MRVLVGSKNASKINGAKLALVKYYKDFTIEGINVHSDVENQPVGMQTFQGANNRVCNLMDFAKNNNEHADLFIAIEAGLVDTPYGYQVVHVAVIGDNLGNKSVGTSAGFPVPNKLVDEIKSTSLADVVGNLFNQKDVQAKGSVSVLTKGAMSRENLVEQACIMAFTKFVNGDIWTD